MASAESTAILDAINALKVSQDEQWAGQKLANDEFLTLKDDLKRIFERFERLEERIKAVESGNKSTTLAMKDLIRRVGLLEAGTSSAGSPPPSVAGSYTSSTASSSNKRMRTDDTPEPTPPVADGSRGARPNVLILLGFPVAVSKAAIQPWLEGELQGSGVRLPEVRCKPGSKHAILEFGTKEQAGAFRDKYKDEKLRFRCSSSLFEGSADITIKQDRNYQDRLAGKMLAPAWQEVHNMLNGNTRSDFRVLSDYTGKAITLIDKGGICVTVLKVAGTDHDRHFAVADPIPGVTKKKHAQLAKAATEKAKANGLFG